MNLTIWYRPLMSAPTRSLGDPVALAAGGPSTTPILSRDRGRTGIVAAGTGASGSVVSVPSPVPSPSRPTGSAIRPPARRIHRRRSGLQAGPEGRRPETETRPLPAELEAVADGDEDGGEAAVGGVVGVGATGVAGALAEGEGAREARREAEEPALVELDLEVERAGEVED